MFFLQGFLAFEHFAGVYKAIVGRDKRVLKRVAVLLNLQPGIPSIVDLLVRKCFLLKSIQLNIGVRESKDLVSFFQHCSFLDKFVFDCST